jgi:hypothetical protein
MDCGTPIYHPRRSVQAEPHASLHPTSQIEKAQDPMVHRCQTRAQGKSGADA